MCPNEQLFRYYYCVLWVMASEEFRHTRVENKLQFSQEKTHWNRASCQIPTYICLYMARDCLEIHFQGLRWCQFTYSSYFIHKSTYICACVCMYAWIYTYSLDLRPILRHLQSLKRPTPMQIHLISHLTQQSLSSTRLIKSYDFDFWSMNILHTYMLLFTTQIHIYHTENNIIYI